MAALNKIAPTSPSRQHPSELETSIANALYDLESNIPDMKSALRPLQFVSAREVRGDYCVSRHTPFNVMELDISPRQWRMELHPHIPYAKLTPSQTDSTVESQLTLSQLEVGHGKKAIVIFVPVPLLPGFHKVQQRYFLLPLPLLPPSPEEKSPNSPAPN